MEMDNAFETRTVKLANDAYKSNKYELAVEYCDKVLKENPDNLEAWRIKARVAGYQVLEEDILGNSAVEYMKIILEIVEEEERRDLANEMFTEHGNQIFVTASKEVAENGDKDKINLCIKRWKELLQLPYVSEKNSLEQMELMKESLYSTEAKAKVTARATRDADGTKLFAEVQSIIAQNGLKNDREYLSDNSQLANDELEQAQMNLERNMYDLKNNQAKRKQVDIDLYKTKRDYDEVAKKIFGKGARMKKELAEKVEYLTRELANIDAEIAKEKSEIEYLRGRVSSLKEIVGN